MYSECPNCHAIFRITPEILARANGHVRCGECQTVFAATPIDSDNEGSSAENPSSAGEFAQDVELDPTQEQIETTSADEPQAVEPSLSVPTDQLELVPEPDIEVLAEFTKPASLIVARPPSRSSASAWLSIASLLLLFTLITQYLLANRLELSQKPGMRPVLETLCSVFQCEVPQRRDASLIVLKKHAVYSHPTVDGALMIEGLLQNDADYPQPYPVVELRLSDIRGNTVALRRFGPDEYLKPLPNMAPIMPARAQVPLQLEVSDPGKNALAFEFSFL